MPVMPTITVLDREDTPVSHAFEPHHEDNGVATFNEYGDTDISANVLTISTKKTDANVKVRLVLKMPVIGEVTSGTTSIPSIVRTSYADVTFTFSRDSYEQERENTVEILRNILAAAQSEVNQVVTQNKAFS